MTEDGTVECTARKKIRYRNGSSLRVGDFVEFHCLEDRKGIIETILPRKNELNRPPVSNVDQMAFLLAKEPYPDFLLIDKLIACAMFHKIDVLLTVNKTDLKDKVFYEKISTEYAPFFRVFFVSAQKKEGLKELKEALRGKTTCFSGQSAVGKSSLLNALYPFLDLETGKLSVKTQRGKNTTRRSEIYRTEENTFLIDTPGFSLFDFSEIPSGQLHLYYPEFRAYLGKCRFDMCTHITEPDCSVKRAVVEGRVSPERYRRYTEFQKELSEKEKNRY